MDGNERHASGHAVFVNRKRLVKTGTLKLLPLAAAFISTVATGSASVPCPSTTQWSVKSNPIPLESSVAITENQNSFPPELISIKPEADEPDPLQRALVGYLGYFAGMLLLVYHPHRP